MYYLVLGVFDRIIRFLEKNVIIQGHIHGQMLISRSSKQKYDFH